MPSNYPPALAKTEDTETPPCPTFPSETPPTNSSYNPSAQTPHVAILLCTYNGERFIEKQLDTIRSQAHTNHSLWVSDDGSTDRTLTILKHHQQRWDKNLFSIQQGPQRGYAANFLSLACREEIDAAYYAFADQDDIWEAEKLSRAIAQLETLGPSVPAMYCARTRLIDEKDRAYGFSPLYRRPPGFGNSLVQSIASGNTMIMNKSARRLLCKAGELEIVSHDWWLYSLVTGAGGVVIYDPVPTVGYRQHEDNVLGASPGLRAKYKRVNLMLDGRFQRWNTINTHALSQARNLLTSNNALILDNFQRAREQAFFTRNYGLWRSGIYRQTTLENLGLTTASLLNKV